MHSLYGDRNFGRGRARRQFRCSSQWSCADNLRRTRDSCQRILVYGMSFGQSGGGVAKLGRFLVTGQKALLQLRVLTLGFFQDRNIRVGVFPEREEIFVGDKGATAGEVGIRSL